MCYTNLLVLLNNWGANSNLAIDQEV